ncbi:hypothetical protein [Maricaulis sp. CAU 1757]
MSGFVGRGRLQEAEWLMRAVMVLNRDLPPHATPYDEDTELNRVYTRQAAEFEALLAKVDPEGEIDRELFPVLAYFNASESWPLDIILGAVAALLVWQFLPDWYGVAEYLAYLMIFAWIAIQYLRARRRGQVARTSARRLGLDPDAEHRLTLRQLVRYRRPPAHTLH